MKVVRVSAPSRIHFGLLALDSGSSLQFGGAGVMVDRPRVEIEVTAATNTQVSGPHANRVHRFIEAWQSHTGVSDAVSCRVHSAPPAHVGLGLGTQLGLAVASALDTFHQLPAMPLAELVKSVKRGQRSGIGSYGFRCGGMIVERGKRPGAALSNCWERIELPAHWRLLLIRPLGEKGLAGREEADAFEQVPPTSDAHLRLLHETLFQRLVPAAKAGSFREFGESVYQYGKLAGQCFAPCQYGAFRSAAIAEIVRWHREHGGQGVGQSSWGPTIFCWCESTAEAEHRAHSFREEFSNLEAEIVVAAVDRGAEIKAC